MEQQVELRQAEEQAEEQQAEEQQAEEQQRPGQAQVQVRLEGWPPVPLRQRQ